MPRLLSDAEIRRRLRPLKGWKHEGAFITRAFEFKRFMDGISFVDEIAKVAEALDHHPDIHVRYTTITLSIQTHSEGGVTDWDLELAEAIEGNLGKKERRRSSH